MSSPPCESDGQSVRKRQRLETDGAEESFSFSSHGCGDDNTDNSSMNVDCVEDAATSPTSSINPPKIIGLRLEAIFHPKFDNENRTTADIRSRMLERVEASNGYLEVSLKHSGSLLLWSGDMRYYSKNSTDNRFAHAGEILLRQHFARAWIDGQDTTMSDSEEKYNECSQLVESRRLTLSFEVVTSVLGQHGDIPRRDFLILTAIADRSKGGRFFDTLELVEFAQKHRLPHNDFWVFQTSSSCRALFNLYDSSRETALADGTIAALSSSCDGGHIQSIYPHFAFQGNVLEGIIIRYVPYERNGGAPIDSSVENSVGGKVSALKQKTQMLARMSEEILTLVPPDREPSFALSQLSSAPSSILCTDIRALCKDSSSASFDSALRDSLLSDSKRKRRQVSFIRGKGSKKSIDVVQMVRGMSTSCSEESSDNESLAIAALINCLDELNIPIEYKVCQEKIANNSEGGKTRTLCIIHVKSDFAFQKFARQIKDGDMPLYRGFVVRLILEGDDLEATSQAAYLSSVQITSTSTLNAQVVTDTLMLKMKFLPYMVRTFGIRNGLSILEKSGSEAYDRYTMNLLKTWNVSREAMEMWQPFFHCWGVYAGNMLGKQDGMDSSDASDSSDLPRLGTDTYLQHLAHFSNLYYSGMVEGEDQSSNSEAGLLRGLVVVVSLTRQGSLDAADAIASRLRSRRTDDINAVTENDLLSAMMQGTGGMVCSAIVEDGIKSVRTLSKKYEKSIYVIFLGCSDDAVEKSLEPGNELKKRIGMLKGWRKVQCNSILEWPDPLKLDECVETFAQALQESSSAASNQDERPGLLIFFPGIPGCGKSFLCHDITTDALHSQNADLLISDNKNSKPRPVYVCVGDKVEGKYWPLVRRERMAKPSSICFADKNAPPTIWSMIGNISAASRGAALPILPDASSLATTIVRLESGKQIIFPFSLPYLAVCMQRVLNRPEASHCGKLDASCKDACMVVVKFYCFYRNLSAEQFIDRCRHEMESAGTYLPPQLVHIPFFAANAPSKLPQDLENAIQEAVRLQIDIESSKLDDVDKLVESMEHRLREALSVHGQDVTQYTAKEEESRSSFLAQVSKHVLDLEDLELNLFKPRAAKRSTSPSFIKIVSIDVASNLLRGILKEMASRDTNLSSYLEAIGMLQGDDDNDGTADSRPSGTIVKQTHVTMTHFTQQSQMDMRSRFGTVVDKDVELKITACLYGENNTALSVALPPGTMGDPSIPLPSSKNQYPHITIWFSEESVAADSSKLPDLVSTGEAKVFQPVSDITVQGKLSYWMIDRPHSRT